MALDDENDVTDTSDDSSDTGSSNGLTNINPDAPDFVKDIKRRGSASIDMNYEFIPKNPYTMTSPEGFGSSSEIKGLPQNSSFYATAKAEAKSWNYTSQAYSAAQSRLSRVDPLDDIAPPDWTPKTDQANFVNIQPKNLAYMFAATGPKDQQYRLQRVMAEQADDEALANGSFAAKLLGGVVGVVTDPISYIPIVGWAKYGKLAPTVIKSIGKSLPGVAASSFLSSAAEQANKVNGNMTDFFTDSFVRTVFGSVLFGVGGAAALTTEKAELWKLNKFAKNSIDGIDYKLATDEAGKVTGFKAYDKTGNLSAAKVNFAQDLANSSFNKSGVFKVPFLGEAVRRFVSMPVLGSPLPRLLNSKFQTVRGFVDRVADHSIITKGVADDKAAPEKFASLMNQEFASIRALSAQVDSLHLERNGFDITNRPLGGLINLGLNLKDKSLKVLADDIDSKGYISKEDFHSEIEEVLRSDKPSKHAPVNEASKMMRTQMDTTYAKYREAYNLSPDWLPPKTAEAYLMRVYDTPYMNTHENEWIDAVGGWLKEADQTINLHMQPVRDLEQKINLHKVTHKDLISRPNVTDEEVKKSSNELFAMKARKNALEEQIQNKLRSDPELSLHVEDWNALSADEAKQVEQLTKKQNIALKEVNERKKIVANLKAQIQKSDVSSIKGKTAKTAKNNIARGKATEETLKQEQEKLSLVQREYEEETESLQERMHNGEIDNRLFQKSKSGNYQFEFKNPNERLKFRETYLSEKNPQSHETAAKAYYDTILNQTPEDTINQVMGKFTGNNSENHIKQRTLLIPDEVLYQNNFMAKDLMSKVSNYTTYLSRRTHLKNVFNDVTHDGGIEPLLNNLAEEHEKFRAPLNEKRNEIAEKLSQEDISASRKKELEKQKKSVEKELITTRKEFDTAKEDMNHIFEKMMGVQKSSRRAQQFKSAVMSITAWSNLPFVPFTMINDLSAVGLQHGIWPFIRDGVYPVLESIGGLLKTKDSEALRKTAPSIHLALQDVLNGYADRNWSMHNNPYLNLGKVVNTLEKVAHASTNFTLTNYIDNGLQRITSAVTQSELMRILHAFQKGTMSKSEGIYIRKYGIDPKEWSERMIGAFNENGGGKTKLGGYQSNFWHWTDTEAANKFGNAVFRGVKDTQIQSGIADSPFWTDSILGSIIKGFNGWTYASVNRYVIPSMQQPDAQKLLGVLFMLGTGSLVSPMRRIARGESPFEENTDDKKIMWQTIQDSGYFSFFANMLEDANVLTGSKLLGDLKNDKYRDRTRAGLLGPAWGTVNRMADIVSAAGSGEWNKADMLKAARMMPFANASWTFNMSKKMIESLNLPETRTQAKALKSIN